MAPRRRCGTLWGRPILRPWHPSLLQPASSAEAIERVFGGLAPRARKGPLPLVRSESKYRWSSKVFVSLLPGMESFVTGGAQRDEILFDVLSEPTPRADVVNLKLIHATTALAAPPVALQHLPAEPSIGFRVKSQSRASWARWGHEAFRTCSKNSFCLGCGRNSKSRPSEISKASGFPFSRLAPAKKSAQIISRQ